MRKDQIERFINRNIQNFAINPGWSYLVRDMLFEICLSGIDLQTTISGKTKFGELRAWSNEKIEEENSRNLFNEIVERFAIKSHSTCEVCGNVGRNRIVNFWEETLCTEHYIRKFHAVECSNSKEFILHPLMPQEYLKNQTFKFSQLSRVEFEREFSTLYGYSFSAHSRSDDLEFVLTFHSSNYYKLLKFIPKNLLNEEARNFTHDLQNEVKECEICGFRAVHRGHCLNCRTDSYETSFSHEYMSKQDYIKQEQMKIQLDEDDWMKLKSSDDSFEKSPIHRLYFTFEDWRSFLDAQIPYSRGEI